MSAAIQTHELISALQLATSNKEGVRFLTALAEALPRSPHLVSLGLIEELYEFTTRRSYQPARARAAQALAIALSLAAAKDAHTFTSRILAVELAMRSAPSDRSVDLLRRKALTCVLAILERDPLPLANQAMIASLVGFASSFEAQRQFVYRVLVGIVGAAPQLAPVILSERDAYLGRWVGSNYAIYDRLTGIAKGNPSKKQPGRPALLNLTAELARLSAAG
jgi:hypothetical protein